MDKSISVTILGRSYRLRVAEEDEAFTRRVAELVGARAEAEASSAPGFPALTHMALTALSLGEELLTARQELNRLRTLEDEAGQLAARLDSALDLGPAAPRRRTKSRTRADANPASGSEVRQANHAGSEKESSANAAPGSAPATDDE